MKLNLNKRDRICFFGDSITAHGFWIKEICEYFKDNYAELKIGIFNCGIPGSKGYEANIKDRMYADLFNFFPKYVVVMFGMNDIWTWLYDPNCTEDGNVQKREKQLKRYPDSLEFIIDMCKKNGAEPIICSPTVYDEYTEGGSENFHADGALKKCADYAKKTAEKHGLIYIDMRSLLMENMSKKPIREDRVHPNEYGHHLMAHSFLRGIGENTDIDSVYTYSEVNERRFMAEQDLRNIEFVERDVMLWQYEEVMPLEERKEKVRKRAESDKNSAYFAERYLKNVDYRNVIYKDVIKLTAQMYE